MKVCFARVDRIGDLILTLPVEYMWRAHRKDDEIEWLVHENLRFVVANASGIAKAFFVQTPLSFFAQLKACLQLRDVLLEKKFDTVIGFHVPWWVAFAFALAKIKTRVGVASQWFSWICFNKRIRQKRSQALKHESEYNLELAGFASQSTGVFFTPVELRAPVQEVAHYKNLFNIHKINLEKAIVIHAGMAGSARNWPASFYFDLGQKLLAEGYSVILTGSRVDQPFVLETKLGELKNVLDLVGNTTGEELLSILSLACAVVAPSTGVAHLAASLGKRVVGIYSPVRVQAPKRWAPRGRDVRTLVPQVPCPGVFACFGKACPHYDCMEQITVDSVLAYVKEETS